MTNQSFELQNWKNEIFLANYTTKLHFAKIISSNLNIGKKNLPIFSIFKSQPSIFQNFLNIHQKIQIFKKNLQNTEKYSSEKS